MTDPVFVDTNILVYAEDVDAGAKHAAANDLVRSLWENRSGVLSIQVLQELYVTLTQKVRKPLSNTATQKRIDEYLTWRVMANTPDLLRRAMAIKSRHSVSFWDASILAAARLGNCKVLYSEDLTHNEVYDGVKVVNPLL